MKEEKSISLESLMMQRRIVYDWASSELDKIIEYVKKVRDMKYLIKRILTLTEKLGSMISDRKIPGKWIDRIFFDGKYPLHKVLIDEYGKHQELYDENADVFKEDVKKLEAFGKEMRLVDPASQEFASLLEKLNKLYLEMEEKEREAKTIIYLERI